MIADKYVLKVDFNDQKLSLYKQLGFSRTRSEKILMEHRGILWKEGKEL